jgi:hypothetical protein
LRDAGTGAGLEEMTQLRRLAADSATVAPRLRLYKRWPNTSRTKTRGTQSKRPVRWSGNTIGRAQTASR